MSVTCNRNNVIYLGHGRYECPACGALSTFGELGSLNRQLSTTLENTVIDMMREIGPEVEEVNPRWRDLCLQARKLIGVHPRGL